MTSDTELKAAVAELTWPISGIENRSALEVFDIMSDRIKRGLAALPDPAVARFRAQDDHASPLRPRPGRGLCHQGDPMTDLLARLQEAESGSRELDTLVWIAANPSLRIFDEEWPGVCIDTDGAPVIAESATTSLDAIVSLIGEKLPEITIELMVTVDQTIAELWYSDVHNGKAKTAPLALCIALLRALEGQDDHG